jgi:hypothetical protein
MGLNTLQEIERAITALKPRELEELYSWLTKTARNQSTVAFSLTSRRDVSTTPHDTKAAYDARRAGASRQLPLTSRRSRLSGRLSQEIHES